METCRQIREEARDIWYDTNLFHVIIRDCDDSLVSAFVKHTHEIDVYAEIFPELAGKKDWSNLMKWCRNVFEDDSIALYKRGGRGQRSTVVAAAHDIVHQHADWDECEHALETLGTVVRKLRPKWTFRTPAG